MIFTCNFKEFNTTGSPGNPVYTQSIDPLNLTNLNFKLSISKNNGVSNPIINTTNLAAFVATGLPLTFNYGVYDIVLNSIVVSTGNHFLITNIQVYLAGTMQIVTWEKFNIYIEASKTGYQSYDNMFEFYNYDTSIDLVLTNNTNNTDGDGIQTKMYSAFKALRQPFTGIVYLYNTVGTQGNIGWTNGNGLLGYGKKIKVTNEETDTYTQTITNLTYTANSTQTIYKSIWYPSIVTSYDPDIDECTNCVNNIQSRILEYYLDASTVTHYDIDGEPRFLCEFLTNKINIQQIDGNNNVIYQYNHIIPLTLATWALDNSTFLTPISVSFNLVVGINYIVFNNNYLFTYEDVDNNEVEVLLRKCITTYTTKACSWFNIELLEDCGKIKVSNCGENDIDLTIQVLNEDKTFTNLSTITLNTGTNEIVDIVEDGLYVLYLKDSTNPLDIKEYYYTLPSYCNLEQCMLEYLNKTLCYVPSKDNCNKNKEDENYNFNALLINAHAYFIMLEQEMNGTYLYDTINSDKLNQLYQLKQFIDKMKDYCTNDNGCKDCN